MNLGLLQAQITLMGLLLQILSVIFVWKTVRISEAELDEMGRGAIGVDGLSRPIFGTKSTTATSALRRQYESLVGMATLFVGIIL